MRLTRKDAHRQKYVIVAGWEETGGLYAYSHNTFDIKYGLP
ncbi:hypothetical protein [Hymenobacter rubripertinctus]|nr:hypothetical protein [Hymenobacter rubripertinctus]